MYPEPLRDKSIKIALSYFSSQLSHKVVAMMSCQIVRIMGRVLVLDCTQAGPRLTVPCTAVCVVSISLSSLLCKSSNLDQD